MTTPAEEQVETTRPRRWLRLSVRALMVVVVVLAVALGWFVRRARVQREAVAAIERSGGQVRYDWEVLSTGGLNPNGKPRWPRWVVDRLGPDYFGHVVLVELRGRATDAEMAGVARFGHLRGFYARKTAVTDEGLAALRGASQLEMLHLMSNPAVSGASLAHFQGLPNLRHLTLSDSRVADGDLAHLEGMPRLEWLDLSGAGITSEGLAHLKGLTGVTRLVLSRTRVADLGPIRPMARLALLDLGSTRISDDGLTAVEDFGALQYLTLTNGKVTDAGLAHVSGLATIKNLRLAGTGITDAGLARLCGLANLDSLDLSRTGITDAGLTQLARVQGLRTLNLQETPALTDAGLAGLRKALPTLRINRAPARRPASVGPATPSKGP
jgi:hypothetical protein